MALRSVSRNNVAAGALLLACLLLAILVSVWISGLQEPLVPSRSYIVRFALEDGAAGLRPGSRVTIGGLRVGRVEKVTLNNEISPPALDVRIAVRAVVTLYENALVFLERPLLGSQSEININAVGHADAAGPFQGADNRLSEGEVVEGRLAVPPFLAAAGFGPAQAQQVRMAIAQVAEMSERMDQIVARVEPEVGPGLEALRGAVDDVRAVTSRLSGRAPEWTERIDSVLAGADAAAGRAPAVVEGAGEVVGSVRAMVDENRPRVDSIVRSVESATAKVDTGTVDQLNATLASARSGIEGAGLAVADAGAILREQLPSIRRTFANLRLASDQLKLVTVEVRRNPWRLLYRPKTRELENELLYDATRAYAEAVSDLRAASESLEAVAAGAGAGAADRESIEGLRQRVQEAFSRYEAAERAFLERAVGQSR